MTEFKVWRTIVDWVIDTGGLVYAGCPPGSSVFGYSRFCLIDPISSKRDEPDILFSLGDNLYIVECKPSLRKSISRGRRGNNCESDIDKLRRIYTSLLLGNYDDQFIKNLNVDISKYNKKIAIGFAQSKSDPDISFPDITRFIVNNDFRVTVLFI